MSFAQLTTILGLVGLIASVALLTWQTRSVAQQTKISNAIAGASVLESTTSDLREVLKLFVERPELRTYFYESRSVPEDSVERSRVFAVAEIYGDTLETGLVTNRLVPSTESFADWTEYCRQLLMTSPVLDGLTMQHPEWWPELAKIASARNRADESGSSAKPLAGQSVAAGA